MIDHSAALSDPARLARLARYDLDSPGLRARLDALARRTAVALDQPIALVNLVLDSAQLLIGATGLDDSWILAAGGTPVEWSFCATTVVTDRPHVVADASVHPVHHDNPLVTLDGLMAYAGVPLCSPDGDVLGATCVLNLHPQAFTCSDLELLEAASREAASILEEYALPEGVDGPAATGDDGQR